MAVQNVLSVEGTLVYGTEMPMQSINPDRHPLSWREWLELGNAFIVQTMHPGGYAVTGYTARCEQAKGRKARRWYGYKRVNGKLTKRYLGRTEDLTLELLREAINRFSAKP